MPARLQDSRILAHRLVARIPGHPLEGRVDERDVGPQVRDEDGVGRLVDGRRQAGVFERHAPFVGDVLDDQQSAGWLAGGVLHRADPKPNVDGRAVPSLALRLHGGGRLAGGGDASQRCQGADGYSSGSDPADYLGRGPAVDPLGGRVPGADDAVQVERDNCQGRALDERPVLGPHCEGGVLGGPHGAQVRQEDDAAAGAIQFDLRSFDKHRERGSVHPPAGRAKKGRRGVVRLEGSAYQIGIVAAFVGDDRSQPRGQERLAIRISEHPDQGVVDFGLALAHNYDPDGRRLEQPSVPLLTESQSELRFAPGSFPLQGRETHIGVAREPAQRRHLLLEEDPGLVGEALQQADHDRAGQQGNRGGAPITVADRGRVRKDVRVCGKIVDGERCRQAQRSRDQSGARICRFENARFGQVAVLLAGPGVRPNQATSGLAQPDPRHPKAADLHCHPAEAVVYLAVGAHRQEGGAGIRERSLHVSQLDQARLEGDLAGHIHQLADDSDRRTVAIVERGGVDLHPDLATVLCHAPGSLALNRRAAEDALVAFGGG